MTTLRLPHVMNTMRATKTAPWTTPIVSCNDSAAYPAACHPLVVAVIGGVGLALHVRQVLHTLDLQGFTVLCTVDGMPQRQLGYLGRLQLKLLC